MVASRSSAVLVLSSLCMLSAWGIGRSLADEAVSNPADRPKAPFKVLYSNDFTNMQSCVSPYHGKRETWSPEMIDGTVEEVARTGVDVHMLQPCTTWVPWWPSKVYSMEEHHRWWNEYFGIESSKDQTRIVHPVHRYILDGGDPFGVFLTACRRADQKAFISVRLNDGHHLENVEVPKNTSGIHTISKFYAEHPEYRIGPKLGNWDQHVHNWAIPEARAHKLALIRELCEMYDMDGLELDFMRHTSYFRLDETTPAQRCKVITEFVAEVRRALDANAPPGKRPWLCARVPGLVSWHDRLGIDLVALYEAGLDMVNVSSYYFTQQHHDLAEIRKLVPRAAVYLEMCHCTMTGQAMGPGRGDIRQFTRTTDQQFYTTAHVAYRRGADGVSLFNFVYYREHGHPDRAPFNEPPFHVLKHLGDPEWLARQPQWYVLAKAWNTPLPKRFERGQTHLFTLDMAPTEHQKADGLVRLRTAGDSSDCRWSVTINSTALDPAGFVRKPLDHPYEAGLGEPSQYACFRCPRAAVQDGPNEIAVTLQEGPTTTIECLDLVLP
ncbi:MAG: hypothetical protein ABIP48_03400 [Planctomycetota bacterium]